MKIKFNDLITTTIGLIYLFYSTYMLAHVEFIQLSIHILRGFLFLITLTLIVRYKHKNKNLFFIYIPLLFFYLSYGLIKGNWVNFLIYDLLNSFLFIFIFLMTYKNRDQFTEKIIDLLSILVLFGTVSTIYYFYSNGVEAALSISNRLDSFSLADDTFDLKYGVSISQVSLVLFPFIWFLDLKRKLIISFGLLTYFAYSLMLISRAGIGGSLLIIFITIIIGIKDGFIRPNFKLGFLVVVFLISSGLFINKYSYVIKPLIVFSAERFIQGFEKTEVRYKGGVEFKKEEPRDIEAREYYSTLEPHEYIIGQGMGGVNRYAFGRYSKRGLPMMHRGENNLVMKGGVVLLIFVYGLAIISIIKLFKSKTKYGHSYMAVMLLYLLLERGHQQFSQFFMLLFLCLAISYAFSIKSRKIS